jgi:hypothetical protein
MLPNDSPPSRFNQTKSSSAAAESAALCAPPEQIHLVFFAGCSSNQHEQTFTFFHQAWQVQQPGNITGIIVCNDVTISEEQQNEERQLVRHMSDRFHLHYYTLDDSLSIPPDGPSTHKPFALKHWMETFFGYPNADVSTDDMVIAVMEPNMILLQPLLTDFGTESFENTKEVTIARPICVKHGYPVAQSLIGSEQYHRLASASNKNNNLTSKEAVAHVSFDRNQADVDSPYLLTARDMYQMLELWCQWIVTNNSMIPHISFSHSDQLASQYGYSLAAAQFQWKYQHVDFFGWSHDANRSISMKRDLKMETTVNRIVAECKLKSSTANSIMSNGHARIGRHDQYNAIAEYVFAKSHAITKCQKPPSLLLSLHLLQRGTVDKRQSGRRTAFYRSNDDATTCQVVYALYQAAQFYHEVLCRMATNMTANQRQTLSR